MKTIRTILRTALRSLPPTTPAFLSAVLLATATGSRADTVAFSPSGGALLGPGPNTFGYTFTTANPISVTQLGVYVYQSGGLTNAVPMTLWSNTGTVLASTTIPAGTGAGKLNGYLFVTLNAPVVLAAGTYTIGAYLSSYNDETFYGVSSYGAASGITYGASRIAIGNNYPTSDGANHPNSYFGPNFQFNAVPEPSTWALLGVGAAGAGVAAWRRRRALA